MCFVPFLMEECVVDIDVIQWFFDLEKVRQGNNWHVNARNVAAHKRSLDAAIAIASPAENVMQSYKLLAAAFGPDVTKVLLQSDDAFPEVNHSGKPAPPAGGKVLLYVDKAGVAVCADVPMEWGAAPVFSLLGG